MENTNFNYTFTVQQTPGEVYNSICQANDWWGNVEGSTTRLNDEFTYKVGTTWVHFKVTALTPGKKVVWSATDCELPWLKDKKEWKDTSVQFDIAETPEGTKMSMTHVGLTPQVECFEDCKKGWTFYAGDSLKSLITKGKGMPNGK